MLQGHSRPRDFGFRRVGFRRGFQAFVAAGFGYYFVTWAYAALFKLHGSDKLPSELGVNRSTAALVAAAVFVCVIAPIAEEFFFRGFLFGALRRMRITVFGREIGTWVAAIVTGILFGLAHTGSASSQYLIPLGFLGFVLCLVRWRTGSLYPCMALHSFNNSLALGVQPAALGRGTDHRTDARLDAADRRDHGPALAPVVAGALVARPPPRSPGRSSVGSWPTGPGAGTDLLALDVTHPPSPARLRDRRAGGPAAAVAASDSGAST